MSPGGIGRLMYNFAQRNRNENYPVDLHLLLAHDTASGGADQQLIEGAFADLATIHYAPAPWNLRSELGALLARSILGTLSYEDLYAQSMAYAEKLLEIEKQSGLVFDLVEFPDFKGWGTVPMAMKKAAMGFSHTAFSVRLHSTQSILYHFERYTHQPGPWLAYQFEMEKQGLENADIVIGHIPAVAEYNKNHFGITADWEERLVIEFPPILLDDQTDSLLVADQDRREDSEHPDFIFSSRLQQFKRPDLFVLAAVSFLSRNKDYGGSFRLVSYGWDRHYIDHLLALIPYSLSDKILIIEDATPEQRLDFLRSAIAVIPSDYESLCLFAFETAIMKSKVILNANCMAFGDHERWRDGENCLLFDGSASGLADVMEKAIMWQPRSYATATPTEPYWQSKMGSSSPDRKAFTPEISVQVSAVFFDFRRPSALQEHLLRCIPALPDGCQVYCFIGEQFFRSDEDAWLSVAADAVELVLMPGKGYDPQSLSAAFAELPSDYLILVSHGYRPRMGALAKCVEVANLNPTLQYVSGQICQMGVADEPEGILLFNGDMKSMALQSSRILPAVGVLRKSLLSLHPFDTLAGQNWFEAWSRTLVLANHSTFLLPEIVADYTEQRGPTRNSPKLTGYIMGQFGHDLGLSTMLLTLDQHQTLAWEADRRVLRMEELRPARQISPSGVDTGWNIVDCNEELGGLLVHPIDNEVTVATLAISGSCKSVRAYFDNNRADNGGVEVAIAAVSVDHTFAVLDALKAGALVDVPWSGWGLSMSGTQGFQDVSLPDGYENFQLLFLTKVPHDSTDRNCQLVYTRVEMTAYVNS